MSDTPDDARDLGAVFRLDQEEATTEQATRDQEAWGLRVRQMEGQAELTEAQARASSMMAAVEMEKARSIASARQVGVGFALLLALRLIRRRRA